MVVSVTMMTLTALMHIIIIVNTKIKNKGQSEFKLCVTKTKS